MMWKVMYRYWRRRWALHTRMRDFERNGMRCTLGWRRW